MDSLPYPDFDLIVGWKRAQSFGLMPIIPIQTSRGCPFGCTFCVWPQLVYGNRRYRPRRLEKALDEVALLIEQYGCESFYFDDDTANIGEERMKALAEAGFDLVPVSRLAR